MLVERLGLFLYCCLPLEGEEDASPSWIQSFGGIHTCKNSLWLLLLMFSLMFTICSGISTCCSLMTTFSRWRTGFLTLKPTRCPSFARAACRTKPHRTKQSPTDSKHPQRANEIVTDVHSHTKYSKHQLNAGSGASLELFAFGVFYSDCKFFFAGLSYCSHFFFVDNQNKHDFLWKEHLFLSFFPLWGNQIKLQTQMYGRWLDQLMGHIAEARKL